MVSSPEAPSPDEAGEVSSSDSSVCGDLEDGEVEEKPKESIQLVSEVDHERDAEDGEDEDPDLEDGEVDEERPIIKKTDVKTSSGQKIREVERELEPGEELEEGEVSDDEDRKNKGPIPLCRFFGKGQCTWGSNCRFLHPGVIDKGLYTMFDQIRPAPTPLPGFPAGKPGLLGHAPPSFPIPVALKHEEPIIESAWERAQRHAKEIMKQAEKRKETDIDFEDKKMNLTLTQEEFDKENDYYVKKLTTPERDPPPEDDVPEIDEWDLPSRRPLPLPPPHLHSQGLGSKIDVDFVRERVHHLKPNRVRHAPPRDSIREAPPLHEPEVRMVRESSFRKSGVSRFHPAPSGPLSPPAGNRVRRSSPFEDRPPYRGGGGDRDRERKNVSDGWRDPWDRPQERKTRKNSSLSKRSSYSSGSSRSSSSSTRSSKSSKGSRSRSRSRSSHSSKGSPRRRKGRDDVVRKAPPRRLSPKPMRIAPPLPPQDGFTDNRRGFVPHYNNRPTRYAPPPPRPGGVPGGGGGMKDRIGDKIDPPGPMKDRNPRGMKRQSGWDSGSHSSSRSRSRSRSWSPVKRRIAKRSKFSRDRSRSKSRGSWSRSRSSSSSSKSSQTSISKSRVMGDIGRKVKGHGSPSPVRLIPPAKIKAEPNEDRKFIKSKQQQDTKPKVKMTLRPSSGLKPNKSILDKLADVMGDEDDDDVSNPNSPTNSAKSVDVDENSSSGKMKPSRREELLKQLQLVEEAIAKKRSKII